MEESNLTTAAIITTFAGAFLAPFAICIAWGRLFGKYDMVGSMIAAGFIVGTMWSLNHGATVGIPGVLDGPSNVNMIVQGKDAPWIDMAWAIGTGIIINGIYGGNSFGKALPTFISVVLGGTLAGFILSCVGK